MIDGPFKAPSSPPETPVPIKLIPEFASSSLRRIVSLKNVLPPSIKMSPLSRCGNNSWIVASVAGPALTINIIRRGFSIAFTNSSIEYVA